MYTCLVIAHEARSTDINVFLYNLYVENFFISYKIHETFFTYSQMKFVRQDPSVIIIIVFCFKITYFGDLAIVILYNDT